MTAFVSHTAVLATHSKDLRALGLMADSRMEEFPALQTLAEQGAPALSFDVWGGMAVPKGTPPQALAALEGDCKAGTASDNFHQLLVQLRAPFNYMDGKTFGAFVKSEFTRYGTLLREAGVTKD